jgi:hypothetical protein
LDARSQAPAPPVGLVEVRMSPWVCPTHKLAELQVIPWTSPIAALLHAPLPPVESVEVTPVLVPKTQSEAEEQDTEPRAGCPVRLVAVQAPGPPVGLTEVKTWPASLTAAQKEDEGQDTPNIWRGRIG